MMKGEGLRYNEGKLRYDLVPAFAQEQYVNVLTKGSIKYKPRNWEAGMDWTKVLASLKRHVAAFEKGEDYDPETGLLHMAHAMCNAAFITEYYKIYPEGDDRQHAYLDTKKIGLDIDGVLADFHGHFCKWTGVEYYDPTHWNDPIIRRKFDEVKVDPNFWATIPVLTPPSDIKFEPHAYITTRSIDPAITEGWLHDNGFPHAPVYCVTKDNGSKVDFAKESGVDYFVDDKFENFIDLTKAGVMCYLFDSPHNRQYPVGHKRLYSLKDLS